MMKLGEFSASWDEERSKNTSRIGTQQMRVGWSQPTQSGKRSIIRDLFLGFRVRKACGPISSNLKFIRWAHGPCILKWCALKKLRWAEADNGPQPRFSLSRKRMWTTDGYVFYLFWTLSLTQNKI